MNGTTTAMTSAVTGAEAPTTAQAMVVGLMDHGMTAEEISAAMGQRVSRRTIYRWAKGESEPQQSSDLTELNKLYNQKFSA